MKVSRDVVGSRYYHNAPVASLTTLNSMASWEFLQSDLADGLASIFLANEEG